MRPSLTAPPTRLQGAVDALARGGVTEGMRDEQNADADRAAPDDRRARLAAALRENLKRRKAARRAAAAPAEPDPSDDA